MFPRPLLVIALCMAPRQSREMERVAGREFVHEGLDGLAKRNRAVEKRKPGAPRLFLCPPYSTSYDPQWEGHKQTSDCVRPSLLEISSIKEVMVTTDSVPSPEGPEEGQTGGLCGIQQLVLS